MSLYRKSVWFVTGMLASFASSPWWMPIVVRQIGGPAFMLVPMLWVGLGGIGVLMARCPQCGLSLFKNDRDWFSMATLWPNRTCTWCGHDHTVRGSVT